MKTLKILLGIAGLLLLPLIASAQQIQPSQVSCFSGSAVAASTLLNGAGANACPAAANETDNGITFSSTLPAAFGTSVSTTSDGVHPGGFQLPGNTTLPSLTAQTVTILGPPSATPTAWSLQLPTAIPTTNYLLSVVVTGTNALITPVAVPISAGNGGTGVANTATLTLGSSNQNYATLGTGIVKNTTITGALSDAAAADVYDLFTSCTGSSGFFLKDGGTCAAAGGGSPALSSVTAATGTQTIASGNNPIIWNWAQTSNAQAGIAFGETSAATGGVLTGGINAQANFEVLTATNSTATPLWIAEGSITNTVATPALQITGTWNNASLIGIGILENITNTSSSTSSLLMQLEVGGTSEFSVSRGGNVINVGTLTSAGILTSSITGPFSSSVVTYQGGLDGTNAGSGGTFRGADMSNTTALNGGYAILRGGELTASSPSASALEGVVEMGAGYLKGSAVANVGDVLCSTTTAYTVTDCSHTGPAITIIGIATSTSNPIGVVMDGQALVKTDGAITAIGDILCMGTTTDGLAHDAGTTACSPLSTTIGIVIADSGTVTTMSGNTTAATAMSTTLVLTQLHIAQ